MAANGSEEGGVAVEFDCGLGGARLHEWVLGRDGAFDGTVADRLAGPDREVREDFMSTGAVLAGRGTLELQLMRTQQGAEALHLRYRVPARQEGE